MPWELIDHTADVAIRIRGNSLSHLLSESVKAFGASVVGCVAEESEHRSAHGAYKDVQNVIDVVAKAGLALPVVRLRPLGVVKG